MERAVGPVDAPRRFRSERPGGRLVDAVPVGVGGGEPCEPGPRPRVEGDADRDGEHAGAKRTDNTHIRRGEPLGERLELSQQNSARARVGPVLAARTLDLPPGPLRIDLQADEQLVILGDRRGAARQLEIGLHRKRVDSDRVACPRLAEVAADLVAVGRDGALDPLDSADGRALPRKSRENATPAGLSRLLLGAVEEPKRRHLHRQHRRVRARATVLQHADHVTMERRGQELEVARSLWKRGDRVRATTRRRVCSRLAGQASAGCGVRARVATRGVR